ncbi:MAG: hypothetical protein AAB289_01735, partial [Chloroflexota bacterium]
MTRYSWLHSLRFWFTGQARRPDRRSAPLHLEGLEDRTVPAQFLVTSYLDDGSAGTLRWAIDQANASVGVADEIVFTPQTGGLNSISLTGGELNISNDLTIVGQGARHLAVDGHVAVNGSSYFIQVFHIHPGVTASISDLTIKNGSAGGGKGGGILNEGTLTVSDCIFTDNRAYFGTGTSGGAIYNSGTLTVRTSDFTGNNALANSGGYGGAIYNAGTATVLDSTFIGNYAHSNNSFAAGGAIYNAGTMAVISSTLSANYAQTGDANSGYRSGGAIYNAGSLAIRNSTVAGNYVSYSGTRGAGGGIHNVGALAIGNTIVALNLAPGGTGPDFFGAV